MSYNKRPSRIEKALMRVLMRTATVTSVEQLSERFRLIEFEGKGLGNVAWTPGDKIQVMLGSLLRARTYTPVMWDPEQGRTRILAWSHGNGPGSIWANGLKPGDICQFFGPRRSLDTSGTAPLLLFGDETSFGIGLALNAAGRIDRATPPRFEVSDLAESAAVLDRIGLAAEIVERKPYDRHLEGIEQALRDGIARGSDVALTGRAPAIQQLSRALKGAGIASSRLRAKAYWAPGKAGLD